MKDNFILKFEFINTIFILISGLLLHFTFEWSNNNLLVGIFSPINESTWEHLKLAFFPMLITIFIGYFYFKNDFFNYLSAKVQGFILSASFIIISFYTYSGILGTNYSFINIIIFFISVILGQYYCLKRIISNSSCNNLFFLIILVILTFSFIFFTFSPPHIGLFKDPITSSFGINKITKEPD